MRTGWRAVTAARCGFDEARVVGRIAEYLADLVDGFVQAVVELDEGVGRPQLLTQFFTGDNLARPLEQDDKQAERLVLEIDLEPFLAQFRRGEVHFEDAEAEDASGLLRGGHRRVDRIIGRRVGGFNGCAVAESCRLG